jgi:hypothetical protein
MSPRRGSTPALQGIVRVSGHSRLPDLRCVCCRGAVPDTRSSTRSTCRAHTRNATQQQKRCVCGGDNKKSLRKRDTDKKREKSERCYFVYSRKPSSVSTRGSESPERITLSGSPRRGAVNCGCGNINQPSFPSLSLYTNVRQGSGRH